LTAELQRQTDESVK